MTNPRNMTDVDRTVGANLRRLRDARGLPQEKLAAAIGVTFQQIQKYEKGTNRMTAGRILQASRFLKCDIMDFFKGVDLTEATGDPIADISRPALRAAVLIDQLPPRRKHAVLRLISSMADEDEEADG